MRFGLKLQRAIAMLLSFVTLLGLAVEATAAEPEIPKTPAGELVRQFIQVARKGAWNDRATFVKKHYSQRFQEFAAEQDHTQMLEHLSNDLKGADLGAIKSAGNSVELEFVRGDTALSVKLVLSADREPKIDGMMVAPAEASGASSAAPANPAETEVIAAVPPELERRAAEDKFSGAVLIAKDGQPVLEAAYGYADRENRTTNTVETKFRFGSMGKMFTGVAVLQLVQAGKMKLEDQIAKYLPDYPNQDVANITIYQLLTHTGGTGDIFSPEYEAHREKLKELLLTSC